MDIPNEPGGSLELAPLRKALESLEDSLAILADESWLAGQSAKVYRTLLAGAIQNFEFVYEISVKMLRRRLEIDAASPAEIDAASFRDVLRIAAERGLIEDVEAWFRYRQMRNVTAQTYDEEKARQVHAATLEFVVHAKALLAALEARNA